MDCHQRDGVKDKHARDGTFFLLNLSRFPVFLATRLAFKRTFLRWPDRTVNIYGSGWYGYGSKGTGEWNARFVRNRLLTVRRNSKVISIRCNVTATTMCITATIPRYELSPFLYDLLTSKTEINIGNHAQNLYEQNYTVQLFYLLPRWYLCMYLSTWIFSFKQYNLYKQIMSYF